MRCGALNVNISIPFPSFISFSKSAEALMRITGAYPAFMRPRTPLQFQPCSYFLPRNIQLMEITMTWSWRHLVFVANRWSSGTSSTFLLPVLYARLTTASIALAIQEVQAWLHRRTCTTRSSHVIQVPYSRWTTKPLVHTFFNNWVSSWLSPTSTETTVYVASKSPFLFRLCLTFFYLGIKYYPTLSKSFRLQGTGSSRLLSV